MERAPRSITALVSRYMKRRKMKTERPTIIPIRSLIMPMNWSPTARMSSGVVSPAK